MAEDAIPSRFNFTISLLSRKKSSINILDRKYPRIAITENLIDYSLSETFHC